MTVYGALADEHGLAASHRAILAGGLFAVIVTVVIWALGEGGYFWPVWVMLGAAIGIVGQGWKAYGPSNRITEDDVQREMNRSV